MDNNDKNFFTSGANAQVEADVSPPVSTAAGDSKASPAPSEDYSMYPNFLGVVEDEPWDVSSNTGSRNTTADVVASPSEFEWPFVSGKQEVTNEIGGEFEKSCQDPDLHASGDRKQTGVTESPPTTRRRGRHSRTKAVTFTTNKGLVKIAPCPVINPVTMASSGPMAKPLATSPGVQVNVSNNILVFPPSNQQQQQPQPQRELHRQQQQQQQHVFSSPTTQNSVPIQTKTTNSIAGGLDPKIGEVYYSGNRAFQGKVFIPVPTSQVVFNTDANNVMANRTTKTPTLAVNTRSQNILNVTSSQNSPQTNVHWLPSHNPTPIINRNQLVNQFPASSNVPQANFPMLPSISVLNNTSHIPLQGQGQTPLLNQPPHQGHAPMQYILPQHVTNVTPAPSAVLPLPTQVPVPLQQSVSQSQVSGLPLCQPISPNVNTSANNNVIINNNNNPLSCSIDFPQNAPFVNNSNQPTNIPPTMPVRNSNTILFPPIQNIQTTTSIQSSITTAARKTKRASPSATKTKTASAAATKTKTASAAATSQRLVLPKTCVISGQAINATSNSDDADTTDSKTLFPVLLWPAQTANSPNSSQTTDSSPSCLMTFGENKISISPTQTSNAITTSSTTGLECSEEMNVSGAKIQNIQKPIPNPSMESPQNYTPVLPRSSRQTNGVDVNNPKTISGPSSSESVDYQRDSRLRPKNAKSEVIHVVEDDKSKVDTTRSDNSDKNGSSPPKDINTLLESMKSMKAQQATVTNEKNPVKDFMEALRSLKAQRTKCATNRTEANVLEKHNNSNKDINNDKESSSQTESNMTGPSNNEKQLNSHDVTSVSDAKIVKGTSTSFHVENHIKQKKKRSVKKRTVTTDDSNDKDVIEHLQKATEEGQENKGKSAISEKADRWHSRTERRIKALTTRRNIPNFLSKIFLRTLYQRLPEEHREDLTVDIARRYIPHFFNKYKLQSSAIDNVGNDQMPDVKQNDTHISTSDISATLNDNDGIAPKMTERSNEIDMGSEYGFEDNYRDEVEDGDLFDAEGDYLDDSIENSPEGDEENSLDDGVKYSLIGAKGDNKRRDGDDGNPSGMNIKSEGGRYDVEVNCPSKRDSVESGGKMDQDANSSTCSEYTPLKLSYLGDVELLKKSLVKCTVPLARVEIPQDDIQECVRYYQGKRKQPFVGSEDCSIASNTHLYNTNKRIKVECEGICLESNNHNTQHDQHTNVENQERFHRDGNNSDTSDSECDDYFRRRKRQKFSNNATKSNPVRNRSRVLLSPNTNSSDYDVGESFSHEWIPIEVTGDKTVKGLLVEKTGHEAKCEDKDTRRSSRIRVKPQVDYAVVEKYPRGVDLGEESGSEGSDVDKYPEKSHHIEAPGKKMDAKDISDNESEGDLDLNMSCQNDGLDNGDDSEKCESESQDQETNQGGELENLNGSSSFQVMMPRCDIGDKKVENLKSNDQESRKDIKREAECPTGAEGHVNVSVNSLLDRLKMLRKSTHVSVCQTGVSNEQNEDETMSVTSGSLLEKRISSIRNLREMKQHELELVGYKFPAISIERVDITKYDYYDCRDFESDAQKTQKGVVSKEANLPNTGANGNANKSISSLSIKNEMNDNEIIPHDSSVNTGAYPVSLYRSEHHTVESRPKDDHSKSHVSPVDTGSKAVPTSTMMVMANKPTQTKYERSEDTPVSSVLERLKLLKNTMNKNNNEASVRSSNESVGLSALSTPTSGSPLMDIKTEGDSSTPVLSLSEMWKSPKDIQDENRNTSIVSHALEMDTGNGLSVVSTATAMENKYTETNDEGDGDGVVLSMLEKLKRLKGKMNKNNTFTSSSGSRIVEGVSALSLPKEDNQLSATRGNGGNSNAVADTIKPSKKRRRRNEKSSESSNVSMISTVDVGLSGISVSTPEENKPAQTSAEGNVDAPVSSKLNKLNLQKSKIDKSNTEPLNSSSSAVELSSLITPMKESPLSDTKATSANFLPNKIIKNENGNTSNGSNSITMCEGEGMSAVSISTKEKNPPSQTTGGGNAKAPVSSMLEKLILLRNKANKINIDSSNGSNPGSCDGTGVSAISTKNKGGQLTDTRATENADTCTIFLADNLKSQRTTRNRNNGESSNKMDVSFGLSPVSTSTPVSNQHMQTRDEGSESPPVSSLLEKLKLLKNKTKLTKVVSPDESKSRSNESDVELSHVYLSMDEDTCTNTEMDGNTASDLDSPKSSENRKNQNNQEKETSSIAIESVTGSYKLGVGLSAFGASTDGTPATKIDTKVNEKSLMDSLKSPENKNVEVKIEPFTFNVPESTTTESKNVTTTSLKSKKNEKNKNISPTGCKSKSKTRGRGGSAPKAAENKIILSGGSVSKLGVGFSAFCTSTTENSSGPDGDDNNPVRSLLDSLKSLNTISDGKDMIESDSSIAPGELVTVSSEGVDHDTQSGTEKHINTPVSSSYNENDTDVIFISGNNQSSTIKEGPGNGKAISSLMEKLKSLKSKLHERKGASSRFDCWKKKDGWLSVASLFDSSSGVKNPSVTKTNVAGHSPHNRDMNITTTAQQLQQKKELFGPNWKGRAKIIQRELNVNITVLGEEEENSIQEIRSSENDSSLSVNFNPIAIKNPPDEMVVNDCIDPVVQNSCSPVVTSFPEPPILTTETSVMNDFPGPDLIDEAVVDNSPKPLLLYKNCAESALTDSLPEPVLMGNYPEPLDIKNVVDTIDVDEDDASEISPHLGPQVEDCHYSSESDSDLLDEQDPTQGHGSRSRPDQMALIMKRHSMVTLYLIKHTKSFSSSEEGDKTIHSCTVCKRFRTNGVFRLHKHLKNTHNLK